MRHLSQRQILLAAKLEEQVEAEENDHVMTLRAREPRDSILHFHFFGLNHGFKKKSSEFRSSEINFLNSLVFI